MVLVVASERFVRIAFAGMVFRPFDSLPHQGQDEFDFLVADVGILNGRNRLVFEFVFDSTPRFDLIAVFVQAFGRCRTLRLRGFGLGGPDFFDHLESGLCIVDASLDFLDLAKEHVEDALDDLGAKVAGSL